MIVLEDWQEEGVRFLTERKKALLADAMGLGKTVQAIRACDALNAQKILVVCPASVRTNWYYNFIVESDFVTFPQVIENGNQYIDKSAKVVIISYNLLTTQLYKFAQFKSDVLICDEAHYLKSLESQRTAAVFGKGLQLGVGGVANRSTYIWLLTGTPLVNRPIELYPALLTLNFEALYPYQSLIAFGKQFCAGYTDRYGEFRALGASNTEDLAQRLKGFMLRRTKEQVLKNQKEVKIEVISLPVNTAAQKLIMGYKPAKDNPFKSSQGDNVIARRDLALAKIPECVDFIRDMLLNEDKIVIFAHHRNVVFALQERLKGHKPVIYMGGMKDSEKETAKNTFINDKSCKLFIANIDAAGTGIDGLQRVCQTLIFVEWSWAPGTVEQAIDRLNRMGQMGLVTAYFLVLMGSMEDTKIYQGLARKSKGIKGVLG